MVDQNLVKVGADGHDAKVECGSGEETTRVITHESFMRVGDDSSSINSNSNSNGINSQNRTAPKGNSCKRNHSIVVKTVSGSSTSSNTGSSGGRSRSNNYVVV